MSFAAATSSKSTIPQMMAAAYPARTAMRIGITARNLRNRMEPNTATPKVTRNTMIFLGSMVSSRRPALEAALEDSSRPISATTGPIAAGGSTMLIQSVPNL